jgi:hypothetical protein
MFPFLTHCSWLPFALKDKWAFYMLYCVCYKWQKRKEAHIWPKEEESMKSKSEIVVPCENYDSLNKELFYHVKISHHYFILFFQIHSPEK